MFNLDGLLIESVVDPRDTGSLAPLLDRLTSAEPNVDWPCPVDKDNPPAFTVNDVPIYLPYGAHTTGGGPGVAGPPYTWLVQIGESWVKFTMPDGVFLEQSVKPEHADFFQPLLDALETP